MPEFDEAVAFTAPLFPQSIAATPAGFDLVGSGTSQTPDGFPEIAVASQEYGIVQIYRNSSTSGGTISLVPLNFSIDVFQAVQLDFFEDEVRIQDIAFVNLTDNDSDPDIVVGLSYWDATNNVNRGKVASFVTDRVGGQLVYTFVNAVDIAYPVTGLTTGVDSPDGRNHVLAACDFSNAGGSNPSRILPVHNVFDTASQDYGRLWYQALGTEDIATFPMGNDPTRNIVAGQFKQLTGGGLGGTGNTLDFAAFGADSGITLGTGAGGGAFSFDVSAVLGDACGTEFYGFGSGATSGVPSPYNPSAIVHYDPFSSVYKSLATHYGNEVTLIHNDPRYGTFFHLCDGNNSLDSYMIAPVECPAEANLTTARTHLAAGRLNADAFEDLVFIQPTGAWAALLLGRGSAGSDGRIMEFSNCTNGERNYFVPYATNGSGSDIDHVLCVDLNLDGFDEILITRSETSSLIVLPNVTGQ